MNYLIEEYPFCVLFVGLWTTSGVVYCWFDLLCENYANLKDFTRKQPQILILPLLSIKTFVAALQGMIFPFRLYKASIPHRRR